MKGGKPVRLAPLTRSRRPRKAGLSSKVRRSYRLAVRHDTVRVWLLGGFRVQVGEREIANGEWRLRKARALVSLLALTPGHRLHRERVIDELWPQLPADAARNQLRKVVHEIRHVFGASGFAYLESGEHLALRRDATWVDVTAFE